MGILRHAVLMFGMGQTRGSPLPLDALECGAPVYLPRGQHEFYLEKVEGSPNLPFHAFDTCAEFLGNVSTTLHERSVTTARDFTMSDFQPQHVSCMVLKKIPIFSST